MISDGGGGDSGAFSAVECTFLTQMYVHTMYCYLVKRAIWTGILYFFLQRKVSLLQGLGMPSVVYRRSHIDNPQSYIHTGTSKKMPCKQSELDFFAKAHI